MIKVTDLKFGLIYANNFDETKSFYEKHFGFQKESDMGTKEKPEVFGKIGEVGLWIGGGYERKDTNADSCRATVMLGVESVGALFAELKADNVSIVQDAPVEMQANMFWLQFADPSGNILDVLGGK